MKQILIALITLLAFGCSTPDDENWSRLKSGIAGLPPPNHTSGKRWAANRAARAHFEDIPKGDKFVYFWCKKRGDPWSFDLGQGGPGYTVGDVVFCLNHPAGTFTFLECINEIADNARRSAMAQYGWNEAECRPIFAPDYQGKDAQTPNVEPEWDPDQIADDDMARELVSSPTIPPWLPLVLVGGALVLAGAPEFVPALCALGNGAACPPNPNYPPGSTPQPGGDHP